ncbi:putative quinol monooxygenase [Flavobacterium saccharophilum]|uniref:Quinol monooxygenase YgiN n=1 Tax=Flavobacterium saccharophilum TaxID=29534 RepID=A0A1M7ILQ4_9FLAO|nr:putative quinol monooxygenase [Flavobacterium saccharophilum]SHM41746.1 Quinol monooxygenase YgiN [Flavobacterium saccharophilum]
MENQNPIHVFATWKVKEGQIENVLQLLKTVHNESIKEEGNLFYKIHQSKSDLNTIILFEGYSNEAAVAEHRNSPYFQDLVLGKIVPLLENREIILTTLLEY